MGKQRLSFFKYKFDRGPLSLSALSEPITEGNCRLALQDFFFVLKNTYFSEKELLNPEGYLHTGTFLHEESSENFFHNLPTGTVIYAENIRNRKEVPTDRSAKNFPSEVDYLIALHSAIYVADVNEEIVARFPTEIPAIPTRQPAMWHATAIEGGTCLWTIKKFLEYYQPVAAKRFA